jgi:hypothetical protein
MLRFICLIIGLALVLSPGFQGPIEASQNPNPFDSLNLRSLHGNAGLLELRKLHFSLQQSAEHNGLNNPEVASDTGTETELKLIEDQKASEDSAHSEGIPRLDQIFNRFIMSRLLPTLISQDGSKE